MIVYDVFSYETLVLSTDQLGRHFHSIIVGGHENSQKALIELGQGGSSCCLDEQVNLP